VRHAAFPQEGLTTHRSLSRKRRAKGRGLRLYRFTRREQGRLILRRPITGQNCRSSSRRSHRGSTYPANAGSVPQSPAHACSSSGFEGSAEANGLILPPTEQQANISWQIMTRVDTVSLGEPFGITARLSINLDNSLTGSWVFHGRLSSPWIPGSSVTPDLSSRAPHSLPPSPPQKRPAGQTSRQQPTATRLMRQGPGLAHGRSALYHHSLVRTAIECSTTGTCNPSTRT
jgi:hypothetical protein